MSGKNEHISGGGCNICNYNLNNCDCMFPKIPMYEYKHPIPANYTIGIDIGKGDSIGSTLIYDKQLGQIMSNRVIDIFHPYAGSKTVIVRFDKVNEKTFTEGLIDYIKYEEGGFGKIDYIVTKNGILYSQFGIIKLYPSVMEEKTTPKHEQLKNVRNEKQFQDFLSEHFKDKYRTGSPIEVLRVHENVWNRMFTMHHLNDMKGSTLSFGGEVTLEIKHSLGVLILINDSYGR